MYSLLSLLGEGLWIVLVVLFIGVLVAAFFLPFALLVKWVI